ncbi:3-oxoacyl-ACP reductase [Marinomonas sp. S3726]|uniref:SDR family NAD(P)-dependent oxidoreductase n=1 Tax=Marinomonas sp. S3726 TaxID=579484 RepID=UPI0005FA5030|nr:glucose 1-dehydrogenase [Marinomonas sp. S3726]KJZ16055.1 3-oxoacyl-ACP reductase [Marinomonas sp. S3726]
MQLPESPSFSLVGKRALITGASSGIGLASAVALARAGADVVVAARRLDRLTDLVASLQEEGLKASAMALDISDLETTRDQIKQVGSFDILVNSAGTAKHSPALETQVADYDQVMDINVRGAYFLTREVAKGLIKRGKTGSLINISSQMAHVGGIDRAVYCASKFAVEGFTKAMAIEWGSQGIRVNTVCPTFVNTELAKQTFSNPERKAWVEEKIKLGRIAEVQDIMAAVMYLASDASSMVTGTSLLVDGGWTAD